MARAVMSPPPPRAPQHVSPWTLFNSPTLGAAARACAEGLQRDGYALVDDFLGPVHSAALCAEAAAAVAAHPELLQRGELDETRRSDAAIRDDRIRWVLGTERGLPLIGALTQLLRTAFLDELRAALPPAVQLLHPKQFMGQGMLAVYGPGSDGFRRHRDNSGAGDIRKVSLVYYLNPRWAPADGGQLLLSPPGRPGEAVAADPVADRLVAFWSDAVPHEVAPVGPAAPERIAVSFWLHEDRDPPAPGDLSPLLQV